MIETEYHGALLLRYISDMANNQEREQVETWLAENSENMDTLLQVAQIYHAQRTRKRIRKRNSYRALHEVRQRMDQRIRRVVFWRLAVAASILFGLFGVGSFFLKNPKTETLPQMITIHTNAGMRSHLLLPDSTMVYLNAESTLMYPSVYDLNERRVQLSGEAYFKVAHNTDQPFVVSVAGEKVKIMVTGTEFNLQAYEKDDMVQTTLLEGSVQFSVAGKEGSIAMTAQDQITYHISTGQLFLGKTNTAQVTAWMDGSLIFKDTPMPDVLKQLIHFYSVDFNVQDAIIRDYSFTGTFENRPLFQILDYLKISSGIEYTMSYPDNIEIRKPVIHLRKLK